MSAPRVTTATDPFSGSVGREFTNRASPPSKGTAATTVLVPPMSTPMIQRLSWAVISLSEREHGQKCFLRDLDRPDLFHASLPFLLLLEKLPLPRDVAAVAFGGHVLAQRLHRLARDDLGADRRLEHDLELLPGNQLPQLGGQLAAVLVGLVL